MPMRSFALVVWLCLGPLLGCASTGGVGVGRGAQNAFVMGQYVRALDQTEREIAQGGSNEQLVATHAFALKALARLSALEARDNDAEAARHYQAAKRAAAREQRLLAIAEYALADYYSTTYRGGKGLTHARSAYAAAQQASDHAVQLASLSSMARSFAVMGELERSDQQRQAALELGRRMFPADQTPAATDALDTWLEVLDWTMQNALSKPEAASRVQEAWSLMEHALSGIWRVSDKFRFLPWARETRIARRSILQMRAAAALAATGAHGKARVLHAAVITELNNWGGSVAIGPLQNRLECTRAQIEFSLGHVELAAASARRCVDGASSARDRALLDQELLTLLAQIREASGDLAGAAELYERDIAHFEKLRESVALAERATFFRGAARVPWEGLTRVRTRTAIATRSEADLVKLLQASDGMRVRQLRDSAGERAAPLSLQAIRQQLGTDSVAIGIALAGTEVSIVAITGRTAQAFTLKLAPAELDHALLRAQAAVAERHEHAQLFRALGGALLKGIALQLGAAPRIIFVGDGAITAFPTDLLELDGHRLGDVAVVSHAPSFSYLQRTGLPRGEDRLYAFGDPDYGQASVRLSRLGVHDQVGTTEDEEALARVLRPLPATRTEVDQIAALFEGRASTAFGADATESALRASPPSRHAYIHFATHGVLEHQVPGIQEPALVLADEPGADGFLTASEVATLPIVADLAVLSACSTGRGQRLPGEGVMGMSRAFLAAGSRGVIASLWPVEDVATKALMVRFYTLHRAGHDAPRALQEAKRAVERESAWKHPYYWAGFVLVGEGGLLTGKNGLPVASVTSLPAVDTLEAAPSSVGTRGINVIDVDDYEVLRPFD